MSTQSKSSMRCGQPPARPESRSLTDPETQQLLNTIAADACRDLFASYGVVLSKQAQNDASAPVHLSGIVGFSGPGISGTCVLAASEDPIARTNPVQGSLREWIAELSNQLVGRIKNQLLVRGADVYVTTPVVLRGEHLAPVPRMAVPPLSFETERGNVFVWVEFETAPELILGPPIETMSEGDTMLF
jgi:CheY-specific phosphatase CheX